MTVSFNYSGFSADPQPLSGLRIAPSRLPYNTSFGILPENLNLLTEICCAASIALP